MILVIETHSKTIWLRLQMRSHNALFGWGRCQRYKPKEEDLNNRNDESIHDDLCEMLLITPSHRVEA